MLRRERLSHKHWAFHEIMFLRRNAGKVSLEELSEQLGRSDVSIKTKARKLGLDVLDSIRWTDDEIAYLRRYYPVHSSDEIARKLNKNIGAVRCKAHRLELTKDPKLAQRLFNEDRKAEKRREHEVNDLLLGWKRVGK